ncbi:MAG: hypoxanthine phosphoribosyltransferase [Candidatus Edwardsbacteria bacterium RIFOXYD12_FULL_50_11]|nr:MAG: hypoxanthine phosphoribosyltransferase [Candidatus Edwardsbacteria bacterium RifOxyC12_full_54_24]OGF06943.1 MAG: hypoxanthine phosphoribosyltransferase [Candidatus Edwardsbacteria bacterium RifOxyA12_full_54_48]OGF11080.1 MAG: hypoxanthine phosphoribosyltransferase [Candidatus Edwardsbacteria bacterium GWE2_54_12]OGF17063.1 MAG: hypoxanthine phosphoribosyltransferase [Candidatus Edwardsbacteria bacterium RIFOXYD12_FULL_50_11]OGJ18859.1 MAG: hypoxanthine phosphoribosyltransferase [Candi
MRNGAKNILISREQIQQRILELGREISRDYPDKNPVLVGVLRGSFVFLADLIRAVTIPLEVDFISVESYGSQTNSSGVVRLLQDLNTNIKGRDVILVEDIVDTGITLSYLIDNLKTRNPASLVICALLDKKERRQKEPGILKYVGFTIPDKFVIGYGLDHAQQYRNLPYVSWVEEE